jgi:hypothetical protein
MLRHVLLLHEMKNCGVWLLEGDAESCGSAIVKRIFDMLPSSLPPTFHLNSDQMKSTQTQKDSRKGRGQELQMSQHEKQNKTRTRTHHDLSHILISGSTSAVSASPGPSLLRTNSDPPSFPISGFQLNATADA